MKTTNRRTIVELEKRTNDKVIVGGREFLLDSGFREYWNTVQMASVITTDHADLAPGDVVVVHHFVNSEQQRLPIKGKFSFLEYNQIYCRIRNDKMKALANFILVEPVTYGSTGISKTKGGLLLNTKSPNQKLERVGIASMLSDNAKEAGLKEGDKILFDKNCEYEILVNGKVYYRMEIRDVITTIDNWEDLTV